MGTHECSGKYRHPQAVQTHCGPCPVLTAGTLKVPCPLQPAGPYSHCAGPGCRRAGHSLGGCLPGFCGTWWAGGRSRPDSLGLLGSGLWEVGLSGSQLGYLQVCLLGVLELTEQPGATGGGRRQEGTGPPRETPSSSHWPPAPTDRLTVVPAGQEDVS